MIEQIVITPRDGDGGGVSLARHGDLARARIIESVDNLCALSPLGLMKVDAAVLIFIAWEVARDTRTKTGRIG